MFWQRLSREYLRSLQIRQFWNQREKNLKENDIVIIVNEQVPRCHWPLGVVTKVNVSLDGLVRSADIKTSTGILTRPVNKLVLLIDTK